MELVLLNRNIYKYNSKYPYLKKNNDKSNTFNFISNST